MATEDNTSNKTNPFALQDEAGIATSLFPHVHKMREGIRCVTDKRGQTTPGGLTLTELVINVSEGSLPLWAKDVTLRWKFATGTLAQFKDPVAAGAAIEKLFGDAILLWGDSAPIRFRKTSDVSDFEIVVQAKPDCDPNGCVLASAFFPDPGQHTLFIYPTMFQQDRKEQLETLAHEIGHIFGLRHFFALELEKGFPAKVFGTHDKFTIMNYGPNSYLTPTDKSDLANLYRLAWSGEMKTINGTPIKFVKPFHDLPAADGAFAIAAVTT